MLQGPKQTNKAESELKPRIRRFEENYTRLTLYVFD